MSRIDGWKGKAASYIESAGKKKEEFVDKAARLKAERDEKQRKKMEDWVYKKEVELKELEKSLKEREKLIKKKELKLKNKFITRFIGITAGLSVIGFLIFASFKMENSAGRYNSSSYTDEIANQSSAPDNSEPYSSRESAVHSTYSDIDASNPNFDVGGYCLEKEKNSNITFEECLGVASAKIMSSQ